MPRARLIVRIGVAVAAVTAVAAVNVTPAAAGVLTTGHTGSGIPAITAVGPRLYVAWTGTTGTAAAKALNFGWSTANGKNIVKVTNPEKSPQNEGPALDPDGVGVYLAWPAGNNANTLTVEYFNGTAFSCRTAFTGITTAHSPALASDPSGTRYVGWTDGAGHLNIATLDSSACASTHTMVLRNRVTLADTSPFGPAMVYDDSGSSNLGIVLAWVTPSNAISIGSYVGTTALTYRSTVDTGGGVPTSGPGLGSGDSDIYLSFRGSTNTYWLAYSEGCRPSCFHTQDFAIPVSSGIGLLNSAFSAYFTPAGTLNFFSL